MINSSDTREAHIKSDSLTQYLTSYDAILPLVHKQSRQTIIKITAELREMGLHFFFPFTPSQLAEALLRATGKWTE